MLSKEQHNMLVDNIIDEIGNLLEVIGESREVEKELEEIINDTIDYIGKKYYR